MQDRCRDVARSGGATGVTAAERAGLRRDAPESDDGGGGVFAVRLASPAQMHRMFLLALVAVALLARPAVPGDQIPPSGSPPVTAPETLGVGGQLPADLRVTPLADDAKDVALADFAEPDKPLVALFWSSRCPVCRRYGAALKALAKDYADRAKFVVVFPNSTETPVDARAWLEGEAPSVPGALDRRRDAATKLAVAVTPTALVFDGSGVLRYRGPVDDDRRRRQRDTVDHLKIAIDAVLAGNPVENPEPRAFGSSVRGARAASTGR
jgi:thiol-disulfide isomerase/thioredoxin